MPARKEQVPAQGTDPIVARATGSKKPRGNKAPAPKKRRTAPPKSKVPRPMWLRVLRVLSIMVSILAVIVLIATGYAGYISPLRHGGVWGILPLGFPIVFWSCVGLLCLQLLYCRKGSLIVLAGMIFTLGPILTYFPLNFGSKKAPEGSEILTVMTYNVCNLQDQRGPGADTIQNAMLGYILGQDADIVCLQEAAYFVGDKKKGTYVQPWQIDSLHSRYPYIHHDGREEMLLSKYPVEPIHLDVTKDKFENGAVAAYRLTLPDDRRLTVFTVHLQSLRLNQDDRQLYYNLTDLERESMGDVRHQLLHKLRVANEERARQTHFIMRYLRLYGGPDAIICGDFNDVPGCFAIRSFEDAGFKSVYPEIGLGPMITYNQNRFLFCIDHVLYRGDLIPLKLKKGGLKASDHYPLTVTFAIPPRNYRNRLD